MCMQRNVARKCLNKKRGGRNAKKKKRKKKEDRMGVGDGTDKVHTIRAYQPSCESNCQGQGNKSDWQRSEKIHE